MPGWLLVAKLGRALGYAMPWRKLSEVRRAMAGEAEASSPQRAASTTEAP